MSRSPLPPPRVGAPPPSPTVGRPERDERIWGDGTWEEDLLADDEPWPVGAADEPLPAGFSDDSTFAEPAHAEWARLDAPEDTPVPWSFPDLLESDDPSWLAEADDLPILGLVTAVTVHGRTIEAAIDPHATTMWVGPGFASESREVWLTVGGIRLQARVRCAPGERERLVLGRDVLAGRFLLRP